jgi:Fur family ferric uptake transcriptional regulator
MDLRMTASPDSPPQVFADVEHAIRSLRESGLRLSTARRLVLEALYTAEGPVAAAHLARTLSLDESTVYRNLELLEQRGIVRHLHLGHSPGLYALVSEHEVEYLYCERCAKVTAVDPERLDPIREHVQREFGYTPRFTHFAIVGICKECADALASPTANESNSPHHHTARASTLAARDAGEHEHLHSHGDYVHSHPHAHPSRGAHAR